MTNKCVLHRQPSTCVSAFDRRPGASRGPDAEGLKKLWIRAFAGMTGSSRMLKSVDKILVVLFVLLLSFFGQPRPCGALPPVERTVLQNGLTVLTFQDPSIPAVTLELLVEAGSWRDPKDQKGLANLTAKSVLLGTGSFSFEQINNRLDFLGASLDATCTKDFATYSMQMLKKDLDSGVGLFMDLVTNASFPESEVAKEKDNIIGKIRSIEEEPLEVALRAFDRALYLKSPYAGAIEGTEQSLAGIGADSMRAFYSAFYRPNNAVLVIGGDISAEEVKRRIVPRLLQWPSAEIPAMPFVVEFAKGPQAVKIDKPVSQACIVVGGPCVKRSDKDYYALSVMNNILGSGSLTSRLMVEIRIKMGLAYAVESLVLARKYAGAFQILIQTKNPSAKEAVSLAQKEMTRLRQEPVSEAELEGAKKFLIGNFPLRYSSTQQDYAKFLAQVEFYNLGSDYPEKYPSLIQAVTAQDILRVAREYLKPESSIMTVVADLEKAQMK